MIDSNYHILSGIENSSVPHLRERRKHEQKQDNVFGYKEQISVVIPYLGISLINIHPQVRGDVASVKISLFFLFFFS